MTPPLGEPSRQVVDEMKMDGRAALVRRVLELQEELRHVGAALAELLEEEDRDA